MHARTHKKCKYKCFMVAYNYANAKKVSDILNYKMKFDIEMLNYNYIMHFSTA